MKLVNESLFDFERGIDPKTALGIGRIARIRNFFRDLDLPDNYYKIMPNDTIRVYNDLDLEKKGITWLPDGLDINGRLDLRYAKITELPNNLSISWYLDLRFTLITELPDDLQVDQKIYVNKNQVKLINFIENSISFADKLIDWI